MGLKSFQISDLIYLVAVVRQGRILREQQLNYGDVALLDGHVQTRLAVLQSIPINLSVEKKSILVYVVGRGGRDANVEQETHASLVASRNRIQQCHAKRVLSGNVAHFILRTRVARRSRTFGTLCSSLVLTPASTSAKTACAFLLRTARSRGVSPFYS